MVLYSEFTYGSHFSEEKNGLEIRFLVPEILGKYKRSIFLERPVYEKPGFKPVVLNAINLIIGRVCSVF